MLGSKRVWQTLFAAKKLDTMPVLWYILIQLAGLARTLKTE